MATEWSRVKEVLAGALELDGSARGAFIADACRGDPALRERVELLLACEADAESAFSGPASVVAVHDVPARLGRYAIRRMIAVGGMGVVYEGEQESPQRRVAIKVANGVLTRSGVDRFRQEGEILGRLQHPGIAQIYEAGIDDQSPFLAMELVEGRALTLYAEEESPDLSRRITLMVEVCEAVHHAHIKGVIHRDLKPDNILIDAQGRAKILDFGVARLAGVEGLTLRTRAGEVVGTVPYMSPEQLAGHPRDIDARSDVYSMGVVLYEFLSGRRPFDLTGRTLAESVRLVCDGEPAPLGSLNTACRGDLTLIAAKAMERDPARRYQSAAELGADLRRYLADEPIVARRPTAWYQIRKLARRHRALAAALVAGFACLTAGLAAAVWQAVRASTEATNARLVNGFLQGTLGSANPYVIGKRLSVIELLDNAAAKVPSQFANRTLLAATLHDTIGKAYFFQGDMAKAEAELRLALSIREPQLGRADPLTLESADMLGRVLRERGAWREAGELLTLAVEGRRRLLGATHRDTLWSLHNYAMLVFYEDARAAEPLMREASQGLAQLQGPNHPDAIWTASIYANVLVHLGDKRAEALSRDAFDRGSTVWGPLDSRTLVCQTNLGGAIHGAGRLDEAAQLMVDALARYERTLGLEHPHALLALETLGFIRQDQGLMKEAEELFRRLVDARRRILGEHNPRTIAALSSLFVPLERRGALAEAETVARSVLEGRRATLGPEHGMVNYAQSTLALVLMDRGPERRAEANELAQSTYRDALRLYGPRHDLTVRAAEALALSLRARGQPDEGHKILTEALAAAEGKISPHIVAAARAALGGCSLDQGDLQQAQSDLLWAYERLAPPTTAWFPALRRVLIDLANLADRRSDPTAVATWREYLAALDRGE